MAQAIQMLHAADPAQVILKDIGDKAKGLRIMGTAILVAPYVRDGKTAGGILLAPKTRDEDKYQGKVGLVLQVGPIAFADDATHRFGSVIPKVGDWVLYNVGDTFSFELGERRCRVVEDVNVKAILAKPDVVW